MNKKIVVFLLVLCLGLSFSGVSIAEFDISIFEKNKLFLLETDPDSNITLIRFAGNDSKPFTIFKSDNEYDVINMYILLIPDFPALLCLEYAVYPIIDATNFILFDENTSGTFEVLSSIEYETIETIRVLFSSKSLSLIKEYIDEQITSIKFKVIGETNAAGELLVDTGKLKLLYEYYEKAGGMTQNFKLFDKFLPVIIEK